MEKINIKIDSDVFDFMQKRAVPLVESPNDFLRRWFGLPSKEILNRELSSPIKREIIRSEPHKKRLKVILHLLDLMFFNGYDRNDATNHLARRYGVWRQTVQDYYTRAFHNMNTDDFDRLCIPENRGKLEGLLIKRYPEDEALINNFFARLKSIPGDKKEYSTLSVPREKIDQQNREIIKHNLPKNGSFIDNGKRITQDELIKPIIKVLHMNGGVLEKEKVEKAIYLIYKDIFDQSYYQEKVSHGVPRWKHDIAWAKERAKHKDFIKGGAVSKRGLWELTELGLIEAILSK